MASRMSCPHCKASYWLSAEYNGEAVRCCVCERMFRVRLLLPADSVPYGLEGERPNAVPSGDLLSAERIFDGEPRDPSLIPFEVIDPPGETAPPAEPLIHNDLLPVDPPEAAIQFEVIEPLALPMAEQPDQDMQPRSLLDSLDLTLPVESYLPQVEPERKSLLDALDLTLRKDMTENAPILLEELEADGASGEPVLLLVAEPNESAVEVVGESAPAITLEAIEETASPQSRTIPGRMSRDDDDRYEDRPRDYRNRYERRDYRRWPLDAPRHRRLPPESNWVSDHKGPILFIGLLLSVIVGAIIVVKIMEDRSSTQTSYASEQRRQKRFDAPDWQRDFPPPRMQPNFPQNNTVFEPPVNDLKKPFAQPPMLEPRNPVAVEPKKPRKKSTLPQEQRDWVALAPTALGVDPKLGMPQIDSKPVELAAKGTTYNYLLEVRTRMSGAKAILELGPPGMKLQSDARLVWQVPASFPDEDTDVTLRIKEADGRECSQTFVISIR